MKRQPRSGQHERYVQELRRSNAAGVHGNSGYNRTSKYPRDYLFEAEEDGLFDDEESTDGDY